MPEATSSIPTVSPRERSLIVQVEESAFAENPNLIPEEGTLYRDFPEAAIAKDYPIDQWGGYKYVEQRGPYGLLFVKVKTEAERNTPFKITKTNQKVPWDAVLEWIQFAIASGFPLSQNTINGQGRPALVTADRWLTPRGYKPAQTLITTVIIRHFLSDVEWPDWAMDCDEPQPTEVSWDLIGSHGSMGRCLHPTVEVPQQGANGYRVVTTAGALQSASSTGSQKWLFPKTNHKNRRDYTVNMVEYVDGQYYRQEMTFLVPQQTSKIVKQT